MLLVLADMSLHHSTQISVHICKYLLQFQSSQVLSGFTSQYLDFWSLIKQMVILLDYERKQMVSRGHEHETTHACQQICQSAQFGEWILCTWVHNYICTRLFKIIWKLFQIFSKLEYDKNSARRSHYSSSTIHIFASYYFPLRFWFSFFFSFVNREPFLLISMRKRLIRDDGRL